MRVAHALLRVCNDSVGSLKPIAAMGRLLTARRWSREETNDMWQLAGEALVAPLRPLLRNGVPLGGVGRRDLLRIVGKIRDGAKGAYCEEWGGVDLLRTTGQG